MPCKYTAKTFMLNSRRIHEIYVYYVDVHLFTKYLYACGYFSRG